jgi:hypothetical protein
MRLRLAVIALSISVGCQGPEEDRFRCPWTEEIVPLDHSLGPWAGDLDFDLTPAKILDQLVIPQRGELTWNGGGDWVDITPGSGTTGFASTVVYHGTTVFRRVVDANGDISDGNILLVCPAVLEFDTTIQFQTDDGTLDERWETPLSFDFGTGNVHAEPDAEDLGLPETLEISSKPDPPAPFYDEGYSMRLSYSIELLSPEAYPPTSKGYLDYGGTISEEKMGDIIHVSGFNRTLLEWVGFADGGEPTRRPSG